MQAYRKKLMRLAVKIHCQLKQQPPQQVEISLPDFAWQDVMRQARRIKRAKHRSWDLAAALCTKDLAHRLDCFRDDINTLIGQMSVAQPEPRVVSAVDIYGDLAALDEEFDSVEWDVRQNNLSVTTEPIELQEIYLGPFQIQLDWRTLPDTDGYRVIAVDPSPASCNSSVTHPHVQDEAVCEGEGRQPIRQALQQGRLFDFFLIVANLLRTYNPDSPYVKLSDWNGVECADCGKSVCDDERWTCEECQSSVCEDCYQNCEDCDHIYCSECVVRCETCDEYHCTTCTKSCSDCEFNTCQSCLDKSERCKSCHEKHEQQTDKEEVTTGV